MIFRRLFQFLCGFVVFRASGGFPERFLNLCRLEHVPLWRLRSSGDALTARTAAANYKRLRSVAARSGMRLRIVKKRGAPFALRRYRGRYGLLIGAALLLLLFPALQGRIWSIEVQNQTAVPSAEILNAFAQAGVRLGTRADRLDESAVERAAILQLPRIQWANVNFGGCAAVIEVREAKPDETETPGDAPANLVAARDGTIRLMQPFHGTAAVKAGTPVLKGDLLIGGMIEHRDGTTQFCRAAGYVTAATARRFTAPLPLSHPVLQRSVVQRRLRISVFTLALPAPREAAFREVSAPVIRGVTLPFFLVRYTAHTATETVFEPTPEEGRLLCALTFFDDCCEALRPVRVEQAAVVRTAGGMEGRFACEENVGLLRPLEIVQEEAPVQTADPQTDF